MRYNIILLLGALTFSFVFCQHQGKEQDKDIYFLMKELKISEKGTNAIIVLPLDGCNGCVDKTLNFLDENIGNKKIAFIITDNGTKKARLLHLCDREDEKIVLDSTAKARKLGIVRFYPVLYHLNDGKSTSLELGGSIIDKALSEL